MKIFRISLLVIVSTFVTISCDNYVDIEPEFAQDADNFFVTPNDYDRALTGAYDLLQTSYLDLWLGEIASDNAIAGGESVTDSPGLHEIDEMKHSGVNAELRSLFKFMYAGITRVNYIFENKDKLEFEGKDSILAQASFLRAFYYFQLVKFFGDVPLIVDKRLAATEISSQKRTPKAEVYAQIEADLTTAINTLEWTSTVKGRITKGAALSLLGKAYLFQGKYTEAAQTLDQVIDQKQYTLVSAADYGNSFRVSGEGNSESVFDIQYIGLEGGSYSCFVCLEGFVAVGFHGIRDYTGPEYATGNSYNLPTKDLYDAFDGADIRRDVSVLDIEAWKAANAGVSYKAGGGGHSGYYNNKYLKRAGELGLGDDDLTSPVNHRVIRYADVLLMAAEAHNRKASPDDVKALAYLNEVRARVNMAPVSASGAALTTAIFNERRYELAGEGHRFFDLVRFNKAAEVIPGFVAGKHELFPLPQAEIDLARAGWSQNPGY
jgi:hypothetical protein